MITRGLIALAILSWSAPALAQETQPMARFHTGPLIEQFGPVAEIDMTQPLPDDASFKVAFDIAEGGAPGEINRAFVSAARFLNMHAAAGIPPERLRLALVVHGTAAHDVTEDAPYGAHHDGAANENAAAIATLREHGVRVIMCGQSAAARGIESGDLLPGVEMALSAMTAHALLQQQGYTLNPF